jgi:hypothetical protein
MFTLGYLALKPSLQKVIRLFSVSDPTEFEVARDARSDGVVRELGVDSDDIGGSRGGGLGGDDRRREGEQREGLEGGVHVVGKHEHHPIRLLRSRVGGAFLR